MKENLVFIRPGPKDLLGDYWAEAVGQAWDLMKEMDPETCAIRNAWAVFQWTQCKLAAMEHRIVAGPEAIAAFGLHCAQEYMPTREERERIWALGNRAIRQMFSTTAPKGAERTGA